MQPRNDISATVNPGRRAALNLKMTTDRTTGKTIDRRIASVRGHRVLLDADLARLYGVEVKALKQAVRRNRERFPEDFMFELSWEEIEGSRSQFVTLIEAGVRGRNVKYRPYAFTEQGVAMLSSVLRSRRAAQVNVEIMRAFVRMRDLIGHSRDLARRLDGLESKYDRQFKVVFDAIRELMAPPVTAPKRRIGFISTDETPVRKAQKR
jgi:ORF6N domain